MFCSASKGRIRPFRRCVRCDDRSGWPALAPGRRRSQTARPRPSRRGAALGRASNQMVLDTKARDHSAQKAGDETRRGGHRQGFMTAQAAFGRCLKGAGVSRALVGGAGRHRRGRSAPVGERGWKIAASPTLRTGASWILIGSCSWHNAAVLQPRGRCRDAMS